MRRHACVGLLGVALWSGCGDEPDPIEPPPSAPVASVTLNITNDTVVVRSVVQLVATPRDADGNVLDDRVITWVSSDEFAATVVDGRVQTKALGIVTIIAFSEGRRASATLTMAPAVSVSRRLPTTFVGDTTGLFATLTDADDHPVTAGVVVWSSSDESVATVTDEGIVMGVSAGQATIRAEASGGSGSVELVVLEPRIRPNREITYLQASPQNLHRIGADGSAGITLTDSLQDVAGFDWSPSGDLIAASFVPRHDDGKSGLYTLNPDGSDLRELVPNAGQNPRWSPDGRLILLTRGNPAQVHLVNADGNGLRPITSMGTGLWNPEWSPDGRRIGVHREDCSAFYLIDANGMQWQEIFLPTKACEHVWSPDGKLIAYYSVAAGSLGIWLLNSDGTNPRPLTPNCTAQGVCTGERYHYRPRWSPDGRRLAWVSNVNPGSGKVHIYDTDTGTTTQFDSGDYLDDSVAWSPDGTRLAYNGRNLNGWGSIVVSEVDGGGQLTLTGDVDSYWPVWRK
jgi:TolB protein